MYGGINIGSPAQGTEIVITTKKAKREPYPGYTIFGNGKTTRNGGTSMDILDVCKQLNTAEMNLMQFFRDVLERNKYNKEKNPNLVKPANEDAWSDYLKIALKKNFSHMECVGIIRRVKRGTYMINPALFIPPYSMESIADEWDKLEEGCNG